MGSPNYRLGLVLVTGAAVAWSTAGLFSRLITVDTWTMLAWRGLFGALGIGGLILAQERGATAEAFRQLGRRGWALALVGALAMVLFISSLRYTSVAHVAVIYATVPFLASGVAWLMLREVPSRMAVAASLISLGGVAIMTGFGADGALFGDVLAFGMTVLMAVVTVLARTSVDIPTMPAAFLSALVSSAFAAPLAATWQIAPGDMILLMLFGLTNSAVGLALFILGSRHLPAIETALIGALDAPLAPLWVWLALGEIPSGPTVLGGGIVFLAVAGNILASALRSRSTAPEVV